MKLKLRWKFKYKPSKRSWGGKRGSEGYLCIRGMASM